MKQQKEEQTKMTERKINEQDLAFVIDKWYKKWERLIVDDDVQHKLGFAKENLKIEVAKFLNELDDNTEELDDD